MKTPLRIKNLAWAGLFVVSVLAAALLLGSMNGSPGLQPLSAQAALATSDQGQTAPTSYAAVIKRVQPAVVSILATKTVQVGNRQMPFDDSFFRRFFGDAFPQLPAPQPQMGQGSGVIITSDGYILTNHHVVENADRIEVVLSDRRRVTAALKGSDPKSDLALLKIDAGQLPELPPADSSELQVGDIVFAVGYPFGVGQTVTMGIVSATGRGNLGIEDYEDFIQTDAAINPGNSGGALIDSQGRLIGINTAIIGRSGGNDGIGFAIPSSMVRHVADQLMRRGKVTRGLLGAYIQDMTPELAQAFGLKGQKGALISDVTPDGPAAKAGLERGDVVTRFNGREVPDSRRLRLWVADAEPGSKAQLEVLRKNRQMEFDVTLAELDAGQSQAEAGRSESRQSLKGLSLQDLTPELARRLDLPAGMRGVVVARVEPLSSAARAGLRSGDVIMEVNQQTVDNTASARRLIQSSSGNVLLLVQRGSASFFAVLE